MEQLDIRWWEVSYGSCLGGKVQVTLVRPRGAREIGSLHYVWSCGSWDMGVWELFVWW